MLRLVISGRPHSRRSANRTGKGRRSVSDGREDSLPDSIDAGKAETSRLENIDGVAYLTGGWMETRFFASNRKDPQWQRTRFVSGTIRTPRLPPAFTPRRSPTAWW